MLGGLHRLNPELRRSLEEYFGRKGLDTKQFKVKGQYLPGGGYRAVPGRGNVLLCGDAAGAVDPLSGEGIPFALRTGGDAGRAVAMALTQPSGRRALEIYCADYKDVVASLWRGKFWRWFVYPRVAQRCFAWAFGYEAVRKWMLVGD